MDALLLFLGALTAWVIVPVALCIVFTVVIYVASSVVSTIAKVHRRDD